MIYIALISRWRVVMYCEIASKITLILSNIWYMWLCILTTSLQRNIIIPFIYIVTSQPTFPNQLILPPLSTTFVQEVQQYFHQPVLVAQWSQNLWENKNEKRKKIWTKDFWKFSLQRQRIQTENFLYCYPKPRWEWYLDSCTSHNLHASWQILLHLSYEKRKHKKMIHEYFVSILPYQVQCSQQGIKLTQIQIPASSIQQKNKKKSSFPLHSL